MTDLDRLRLRDAFKATPGEANIIARLYKSRCPLSGEAFSGSARLHLKVWVYSVRQKLGPGTVMNWGDGTYSLTDHGRQIVRRALGG